MAGSTETSGPRGAVRGWLAEEVCPVELRDDSNSVRLCWCVGASEKLVETWRARAARSHPLPITEPFDVIADRLTLIDDQKQVDQRLRTATVPAMPRFDGATRWRTSGERDYAYRSSTVPVHGALATITTADVPAAGDRRDVP